MAEAAVNFDEKFSEVVRNYRILYDKECKEFKDRNKKAQAWAEVAKEMGMTKEEAQTYFRNLRNRYSREKKKVKKVKVSGAGRDDVLEVKSNISEIYPYLQWLEPFIVERKTKSNFETEGGDISDSNDEGSDTARSTTPDIEVVSDTSQPLVKPTATKVTKVQKPSWKFHKQSSSESKKKQNDAEEAEIALIQSLGASIAKDCKSQEREKDEDEIFGNLITSQLKQLPPDKKIWVKMQISNLIYEQMMNSVRGGSPYQMYSSNYRAEPPGHVLHDPTSSYVNIS